MQRFFFLGGAQHGGDFCCWTIRWVDSFSTKFHVKLWKVSKVGQCFSTQQAMAEKIKMINDRVSLGVSFVCF